MATKKGSLVVYVDRNGLERCALVTAVNGLNEGCVTLVYIDQNAPEGDNVRKLYDVRHVSQVRETNAALPTYHLHCWKNVGESHAAPPPDHPAFDDPLKPIKVDRDGARIPVVRPHYEAEVAAHRADPDVAKLLDQAPPPTEQGEAE